MDWLSHLENFEFLVEEWCWKPKREKEVPAWRRSYWRKWLVEEANQFGYLDAQASLHTE